MELQPKTRVELHFHVRVGDLAASDVMTEQPKPELPKAAVLAFAPLHRTAMGVAVGVLLGGVVFLMTAALLVKGGVNVGANLQLLRHYFWGYTVSWTGAGVGLAWGFATGFLMGWGFAVLHNIAIWTWLTVVRSRAEMDQYGDFLDHM